MSTIESTMPALPTGPHPRGGAGAPCDRVGHAGRNGPIPPADRAQPQPLSSAQERLWFLDALQTGLAAYNELKALRLVGRLDMGALDRAINEIVRRHEILRTSYAVQNGAPVQIIGAFHAIPLSHVDLSQMLPGEQAAEVECSAAREAARRFDLRRDRVLRATLLRLGCNDHVLLLATHHIVTDGWSNGLLLNELASLYSAFARGLPSPLPELKIQYADFAAWQRSILCDKTLSDLLSYWNARLDRIPEELTLPTDRPRPPVAGYRGATRPVDIPVHLASDLQALSRRQRVTLFMTLLAAWNVLLSRYSGQLDILVGSPIAGRNRLELEGLIGCFVNNLILRTDLSGDPTFVDLLARVREASLGAFAHQDLPFERLVAELQPARSLSRSPLFQVMFVLQNAASTRLEFAGLEVTRLEVANTTAKFDLTLSLRETADGLRGSMEYSTDLFDAARIDRLIRHFESLLKGIVSVPHRKISELPLLSDVEQRQLIFEWNQTRTEEPRQTCVHELIELQADRAPQAAAVTFRGCSLTYGELNMRANQLAHLLRRMGVGRETLVAVCMDRSPDLVAALLAIFKAGGAYVPLDPAHPRDRLQMILDDSRARFVLCSTPLRDAFSSTDVQTLCLDQLDAALAGQPVENLPIVSSGNALAYVIYTSGTTGTPKGVEITQGSVVNLLRSMSLEPGLDSRDVLLAVTTISFDISVLELFLPLTVGARLIIAAREVTADPIRLSAELASTGATVMQATPATWQLLLASGWKGCPSLKILCGGEALPADLAGRLQSACSALWNLYGPTEATIWSTKFKVESTGGLIPIGRPVANTQVYVLDDAGHLVPIGVPGELCIGGAGVARGYRNRPDLTAGSFVPDPFAGVLGARMFRTGDRARWRDDGNLELLGRRDSQIKLRGYRIEPGEIEAVLNGIPGVERVVVVLREDRPGDKRLVAYLLPRPSGPQLSAAILRDRLREKLPDYMVPAAFVMLDAIPLTRSGKVDRNALPAPASGRNNVDTVSEEPRTPNEESLARIFKNVLGVKGVSIHDNFFDLGGHSLLAVSLLAQIERTLHKRLPLAVLFRHATVAGIAEHLSVAAHDDRHVTVVELHRGAPSRRLFTLPTIGGELMAVRKLLRHLGDSATVYGLQPNLSMNDQPIEFESMAVWYVDALRDVQPQGPYSLIGYSYGGMLAYEVARQLSAAGDNVELLAIIDTGPGACGETMSPVLRMRNWLRILANSPRWLVDDAPHSPRALYWSLRSKIRNDSPDWFMRLMGKVPSKRPLDDDTSAFVPSLSPCWIGAHREAFMKYAPGPYSGVVTLFRSRTRPLLSPAPDDMGWRYLARGVKIYTVPGHHDSVLDEPNVAELARMLRECLDLRDA
jgi:amino acid adenylation domain-containing protein